MEDVPVSFEVGSSLELVELMLMPPVKVTSAPVIVVLSDAVVLDASFVVSVEVALAVVVVDSSSAVEVGSAESDVEVGSAESDVDSSPTEDSELRGGRSESSLSCAATANTNRNRKSSESAVIEEPQAGELPRFHLIVSAMM